MGTRITNVDPTRSKRFVLEANEYVEHGKSIEVDDALAERLLLQPEWSKATEAKTVSVKGEGV